MASRKKIVYGILLTAVLILIIGISYAAVNFREIGSNQQLITGDIYMKYTESSALTMTNIIPSSTYDPNTYFEFYITGKNTNTLYDIYYDIILNRGDVPSGKQESNRIADRYIKFRLVERVNNADQVIFTNKSFFDISGGKRVTVATIPKNTTSEITHTYRLYMWIGDDIKVGNTENPNVDYDFSTWDNLFASIKVSSTGDFDPKTVPVEAINVVKNFYDVSNSTYDSNWTSIRDSITSIEFSTSSEVPQNAITSFDVTDSTSTGTVTLYTLDDGLNNNTYKAVIAADGLIYAPANCQNMFRNMPILESFNTRNFYVDNATNLQAIFANDYLLSDISSLSRWNTSNVTNFAAVFQNAYALTDISALSRWNISHATTVQKMLGSTQDTFMTLKNIAPLANWTIPSTLTNMASLFEGCRELSDISFISGWNVSNVQNMSFMFNYCENLSDITPISSWNVGSVTNMRTMFSYTKLTNLNALAGWNVTNVTTYQQTFKAISTLSDASGINGWNIKSTATFTNMFQYTPVHPTFTSVSGTWNSAGTFTPS